MTVKEMHIELNQSLQKFGANLARKYYADEFDWVLNKIQDRFIQQCLRPANLTKESGQYRFADQIREDAIRTLVVSGKDLQAYKDSAIRVKTYLPDNYQYLLGDVSNMVNLCGAARVETTSTIDLTLLNLVKTSKASAPYYVTGSIQVNSVTINIPGDLGTFSSTYSGFASLDDISLIKDWLLTKLRQNGVEVWWEKYGDKYYQDTFIFVGTPTVVLTWDGIVVTSTSTETINVTLQDATKSVTNTTDNRMTSNYDTTTMYTPFYASSIKSPVSELNTNMLYVYQDTNTTVKTVTITYVRKPQPISLALGSNCELAEPFHQTICDLAVEYIKGQLEDTEGVNVKKQDNETRVII